MVHWSLKKEEDVEPQNPPKYELLEDMANMTYLSEASVVHNLKSRYEIFLIYTVSYWPTHFPPAGTSDKCLFLDRPQNFVLVRTSMVRVLSIFLVFWSFLCYSQSLQMASSIWQPCCFVLSIEKKNWNASTRLFSFWQCLFWYVKVIIFFGNCRN